MEDKKTAGRQKIALEKIKKEANRKVAFSKRRSTLYTKASKIVRDRNVDIGIVLSSPSGKIQYSYVHPTTDVVIDRFVNPTMELDLGTRLVAENARNIAIQNNIRLNELDAREATTKEKMCSLEQMNKTRDKCWWESVDQINAENLTTFETTLNFAEGFLNDQLKKLEIGTSSSLQAPLEKDKKTAGRQKIALEKIKKEANRKVAFSKRRSTLYTKASKIVRDRNVDIGIVLSSPMELDLGTRLVAENASNIAIQNNIRLNELDAREATTKEKMRSLEQMDKTRDKCWWEFVDQINAENLTTFETTLNFAEGFLNDQLKKLEIGTSVADKKTKRCQKIPIEKMKKEANRKVTFTRCCSTLYTNASKIVRDCNVDIGIVLSSSSGRNQYSFVHPTTDAVIDRFVNPTMELDLGTRLVAENARNIVIQNNIRLNELDAREAAAKQKIRSLKQMDETRD
ncbi:hypothetical protein H5410_014127 [Solanum commersonii]|uniref:MADS-box domain-containing protein n=1 Tax=Solanum commersonii TaxID=4109 RepID=A0A9J5ZQI8_SOLCO|nr:hypothetical protein H5410_014127 [Solanum commersonii]